MKSLFIFFALLFTSFSYAGIEHLLPKPQQVEANGEHFSLRKVQLLTPVLQMQWDNFIAEMGGTISDKAKQRIEVEFVADIPQARLNKEEAYTLSVSKNKIHIKAITEKGVYWAIQTLRQLAVKQGKKTTFEGCTIVDYPAFRIRGFMQDVGRTFISLDELKKEIAILSQYKINVFHWHLTENQGWRLESKKYPILNEASSYERSHAQFYTLNQVKELVEFCKQHNVMLIPEIDMPGHSLAFRKAFKHDMQSAEGTQILKELLEEMLPYFDVPYFHIGTDEVQFIRERGKKVISWNLGWDYKESRIWINDTEIQPPVWKSSHTEKSEETPLTNENFEVRPPIAVTLNKGWNKVLIKLLVGKFSTPEVRLVKWHFNFAFVSLDGKTEVEGLRFK